jgi:anti-sigma factor RsiW
MKMTNELKQIDCKTCQSHLADLLLDEGYAASHLELAAHLDSCTGCRTELSELRATFALLDEFAAPEPSAFFDTRLHARLREAQAAEPEPFWERVRSFILFSTGRRFQPIVAGSLALALAVGGGTTFLQTRNIQSGSPTAVTASATVDDLKVLDNNVQAEQQMDQLLDESGSADGDGPPTT